ncbi:MAG: AAA family ATPase, partial [Nocardioides sp.]
GYEVLALAAKTMGIPMSRVDESLATVGLDAAEARRRVGDYSLGMRQRLGIAYALLGDPSVLILDEPANGLDPAGIREIRETIRTLGESGVTVLLSSHILAEVQQVCSSVTIIGNGRMLASGKVDDLIGASTSYQVRVTDHDDAVRRLSEAGFTIHPDGDSGFRVETDRPPADITRVLGESRVWLSELTPVRPDLETVFLDLTSGAALGEAPLVESIR